MTRPISPVALSLRMPVGSPLAADTVVRGRTIDYVDVSPSERFIDRRWLFEVVERFRGDTPDVIEVRNETELGDCADTATALASVGPCYYGLWTGGPDPFAPLIRSLSARARSSARS